MLAVPQLAFVYAPFMHEWFGSAALELKYWLVPLGIGLGVFLLVEVEKVIARYLAGAKPTG